MPLKGYWEEAVPRARKASGMEWPVPSARLSKACGLFLGNNLGGPSCVATVAAPGAASEVTAYSGSLCYPRIAQLLAVPPEPSRPEQRGRLPAQELGEGCVHAQAPDPGPRAR